MKQQIRFAKNLAIGATLGGIVTAVVALPKDFSVVMHSLFWAIWLESFVFIFVGTCLGVFATRIVQFLLKAPGE